MTAATLKNAVDFSAAFEWKGGALSGTQLYQNVSTHG